MVNVQVMEGLLSFVHVTVFGPGANKEPEASVHVEPVGAVYVAMAPPGTVRSIVKRRV